MKDNKKISSKEYIAKYVFLKILFDEYKVNEFVPSESVMANHFNTSNLTIRSAYNILIAMNILTPIKGKGYYVSNDVISYLWPLYEKIKNLDLQIKFSTKVTTIDFYENKKLLVSTKWTSIKSFKFTNKNLISSIFASVIDINLFMNMKIDTRYKQNKKLIVQKLNFIDSKNVSHLLIQTKFSVNEIDKLLSFTKFIKF